MLISKQHYVVSLAGRQKRHKGQGKHYLTEEEIRIQKERKEREAEWKVHWSEHSVTYLTGSLVPRVSLTQMRKAGWWPENETTTLAVTIFSP